MTTLNLGRVVGQDGEDGRGIVSILKTGTEGLVDTYTITYTDGTTSTYTVTNGSSGGGGEEGLTSVYVNATAGNDANDGKSWQNAKRTFANALSAAASDCTLYFEGETNERLNIKTNSNQKKLRIIGRDGVRNRILGGTKLTNFTATSDSNIYSITTPNNNAYTSNYYKVVQDNVVDESTAISGYEAHPAQKGREYRLLSKPLERRSSLANLKSADSGFYYDTSNTTMYVKTTQGDFNSYPIYCPAEDGGIYGNDGTCIVEISNIEVWYAPMLITNCPNAIVADSSCSFALGTGGIKYDDSVNVTLKRCEAAYTLNTSGYGDGINAHSSKFEALSGDQNDKKIKYVSAELIDCWCHDCSDDGWSDHSACEVVIRGGLYEYNHKGGVTPSSGGKCTCYNVTSRKNCRGFYYVSSKTYQKEKTAYFYCENCISDSQDSSRGSQGIVRFAGAGFAADDVGVTASGWKGIRAKFVNCKSLNDPIGFGAGKKVNMNLIDCSTLNVAYKTSQLDDGTITLHATEPLGSAISVSGISLNMASKTLDYSQAFTLTASIQPSNATNKNVTWSIVSGSEYIQISPNNLSCTVTAKSANGSAVVRATTEDGSYTADCSISVEHKELTSLTYTGSLTKTNYTAGESLDITGLVFTANYDDSTSETLTAADLTFSPDPLTFGTTSVDVSYTFGSVTKTVTISGITVDYTIIWEQGAIAYDKGNVDSTSRIRTQEYIDLQEVGTLTITTKNGANGAWWSYNAVGQVMATSQSGGWKDFSEGTVVNQTSAGARYLRIAVKKADSSDITPSEADNVIEVTI